VVKKNPHYQKLPSTTTKITTLYGRNLSYVLCQALEFPTRAKRLLCSRRVENFSPGGGTPLIPYENHQCFPTNNKGKKIMYTPAFENRIPPAFISVYTQAQLPI